jgi:hypothetical protein
VSLPLLPNAAGSFGHASAYTALLQVDADSASENEAPQAPARPLPPLQGDLALGELASLTSNDDATLTPQQRFSARLRQAARIGKTAGYIAGRATGLPALLNLAQLRPDALPRLAAHGLPTDAVRGHEKPTASVFIIAADTTLDGHLQAELVWADADGDADAEAAAQLLQPAPPGARSGSLQALKAASGAQPLPMPPVGQSQSPFLKSMKVTVASDPATATASPASKATTTVQTASPCTPPGCVWGAHASTGDTCAAFLAARARGQHWQLPAALTNDWDDGEGEGEAQVQENDEMLA